MTYKTFQQQWAEVSFHDAKRVMKYLASIYPNASQQQLASFAREHGIHILHQLHEQDAKVHSILDAMQDPFEGLTD